MANWLSPFRKDQNGVATSLQRDVNRLFDTFLDDWTFYTVPAAATMATAVDVEETAEAFLVTAEMPGIDPKDVEITAVGNELTIKAEHKTEAEAKDHTWHRRERRQGTFYRTLTLPNNVAAEQVNAAYRNGILELTLPKKEEAKPRAIKLQVVN